MTSENHSRNGDATQSNADQTLANESSPRGNNAIQYLYIPPGRYRLPPEVLPMDIHYLQRLLPGSEMRRMSDRKYRRLLESQKKRREAS